MLDLEGDATPPRDAELTLGEKAVGRITSAVPGLALGFVRTEVPEATALEWRADDASGLARTRA